MASFISPKKRLLFYNKCPKFDPFYGLVLSNIDFIRVQRGNKKGAL
jgi:hypothetical protein